MLGCYTKLMTVSSWENNRYIKVKYQILIIFCVIIIIIMVSLIIKIKILTTFKKLI